VPSRLKRIYVDMVIHRMLSSAIVTSRDDIIDKRQ